MDLPGTCLYGRMGVLHQRRNKRVYAPLAEFSGLKWQPERILGGSSEKGKIQHGEDKPNVYAGTPSQACQSCAHPTATQDTTVFPIAAKYSQHITMCKVARLNSNFRKTPFPLPPVDVHSLALVPVAS